MTAPAADTLAARFAAGPAVVCGGAPVNAVPTLPAAVAAISIGQSLTDAAAFQGERLICICRLVFCSLVLLRFLSMGLRLPPTAYVLNISVISLAMVFSVAMLRAIHRGTARAAGLSVSVIIDAAGCFLSLMCTALWPGTGGYAGLLVRPDPTALLVMVYSAGFRLSPRLAVLAAGLNAGGFASLMLLEAHRYPGHLGYGWPEIIFFGLALAGASALAIATAGRTRHLVAATSAAVGKVERARQDLTHIVRDQHDARSLLAAVNLNAELVDQALRDPGTGGRARLLQTSSALKRDLSSVNAFVQSLGELAAGQLVGLRDAEVIDVGAIVAGAAAVLRLRFSSVDLAVEMVPTRPLPFVGGAAGLERVLYNLVCNAVEGDGIRGARQVRITLADDGTTTHLAVSDDGPGFPAPLLAGGLDRCLSTKASGSGLGLYGIRRLLEGGGGRLSLANHGDAPGATVTLHLRRA